MLAGIGMTLTGTPAPSSLAAAELAISTDAAAAPARTRTARRITWVAGAARAAPAAARRPPERACPARLAAARECARSPVTAGRTRNARRAPATPRAPAPGADGC